MTFGTEHLEDEELKIYSIHVPGIITDPIPFEYIHIGIKTDVFDWVKCVNNGNFMKKSFKFEPLFYMWVYDALIIYIKRLYLYFSTIITIGIFQLTIP